jgi:hypothetical protein
MDNMGIILPNPDTILMLAKDYRYGMPSWLDLVDGLTGKHFRSCDESSSCRVGRKLKRKPPYGDKTANNNKWFQVTAQNWRGSSVTSLAEWTREGDYLSAVEERARSPWRTHGW